MEAHQGDEITELPLDFQVADLDSIQNPPKHNIEIFELDANNSFTMQLDGEPSGIFHDHLLPEQQGLLFQRTRSTSTCLSTPRSLGIDPTFMDFNLKKTIGETDNIRDEIKHALNEQRIPIKTLGLSEVKINMK